MDRTATGAVALQTERRCSRSRRQTAERERKGSVARLIRRMNVRRAALCRETMMPARWIKAQRARTLQREDRHPKNLSDRAPSFSFLREQQHAGLCSIASAMIAVFALSTWSETGTRWHRHPADERTLAGSPCHLLPPPRRTRNDSRSRSRNRSQSQRSHNACSLSYLSLALECADTSAL